MPQKERQFVVEPSKQVDMQPNNKIEWTEENIAILRKYYDVEPNSKIAERLGISARTVVRKAKELGIYKQKLITKTKAVEDVIREMYPNYSLQEMSEQAHVCCRTVQRVAQRLGLSRTKEEESQMRSRIRTKLMKVERARICFGLDQHTNIRLVTNQPKSRLRVKLKKEGYIVFRGDMTIYYPDGLKRHLTQEENGKKLGLEFAPWCPSDNISNQSLLSASPQYQL